MIGKYFKNAVESFAAKIFSKAQISSNHDLERFFKPTYFSFLSFISWL